MSSVNSSTAINGRSLALETNLERVFQGSVRVQFGRENLQLSSLLVGFHVGRPV